MRKSVVFFLKRLKTVSINLNSRITALVIKNMPPKKIPAKGVKSKKKAEVKATEKVVKAAKVQAKRKLLTLTFSC